MEAPPHDFASLAIIVTDWDALYAKTTTNSRFTAPPRTRSSAIPEPIEYNTESGISNGLDEIWSLLSNVLKNKLREACIGVLRRTDNFDASENCYRLDEDARLLD